LERRLEHASAGVLEMKRLIAVILGVVMICVVGVPVYGESRSADLKAVAERILSDSISEEEFKGLKLSGEELWTVMRWVIVLQGYSPEEADRLIRRGKEERAAIERADGTMPLGGPCAQMVELESGGNQTGCWRVTENWSCDSDPTDKDYDFWFSMWWFGDPDLIRWWSDNWWIRTVFCTVYNCNLLGPELCSERKHLCIGEVGVTAAGGPTFVRDRLKLRHN
jgi:hypothetical protein